MGDAGHLFHGWPGALLGGPRRPVDRPHVEVGLGPIGSILNFLFLGLGHVDRGRRGGEVVIALRR